PSGSFDSIPVSSTARHAIVAHALLESKLPEGEPVGRVIANYIFRYADGSQIRMPIRERFEICVVPTAWGQQPFHAWPDEKNHLAPRYEGRWENAGARQAEAFQGGA